MKKGKFIKAIQRLFDIDVREVSLVDRPAINESFTEIKRKDGFGNTQEEKVMEEKQIMEAIKLALAPLADTLKGVETRLEAQGTAIEAANKKTDELVAKSVEGAKASDEILKGINGKLEEVAGDTIKRFERIEELVTKAKTQKIAGQGDDDKDKDKKNKPKWPSLSGVS
ncbi:hypothetical protein LCGC14_0929250 [marine sediment metagenome]|uniref:Uncharacterized protein n=1 Tax=marine sediment metagenome TaxID=412755 RepID=A0A0F9NNH8_9ZZZZ